MNDKLTNFFSFTNPDDNHPVNDDDDNPALRLIREKIKNILENEPSAKEEITEVRSSNQTLSKHQLFIAELYNSDKTQAEIQTAWHNYYQELSDDEKYEVWDEFYNAHPKTTAEEVQPKSLDNNPEVKKELAELKPLNFKVSPIINSLADVKKQILSKVRSSNKPKRFNTVRQAAKSLLFGLSLGVLVILIFLFSFFNENFIAPFITPSRTVNAQSIILNPTVNNYGNNMIIIPKINVEIPVIYTLNTIDPYQVENSLEDGVVHYATTPYPGQLGNGVIFGHSSNNILNPGKYKFAFVLLHDLVPGDTFMLTYNNTLYVYQVYKTSIVEPNDVSVLNTHEKPATFSLITCDPPGTSLHRLVVVGEQISPNPNTDQISTVNQNTATKPTVLPSNATSLWSRLVHSVKSYF